MTIREIAIAAGVSKSTAAYALHNDRRVKSGTRKLVLETAEKLGYRRDPSLESLVAYRWPEKRKKYRDVVALLTVVPPNPNWARDTMRSKALIAASEMLGFSISPFAFSDYKTPASLSRVLQARGINMLLLGAELKSLLSYEGFRWDSFYMVEIGRGIEKHIVHSIHTGIADSVELALKKCFEHGFKRIGLSLPRHSEDDYGFNRRVASFQYGMKQWAPLDEVIPVHVWSPLWERGDSVTLKKWLNRYKPEVVIGLNGTVLYQIERVSGSVPEQIRFISLHANSESEKIAGIDLDFKGHAIASLRMLSGLRSMGEMGIPQYPERVVLPPRWVGGASFPEA